MDTAKRILAAFLILTALSTALNLILTPLYHDGSPEYPLWRILNWFMAAGVIASLVVSYLRRRDMTLKSLAQEPNALDYVRVGFAWYGSIALTMLFFWGWFWTLNPSSETGEAVTSHMVYFPIVDALFVVIALSTSRYLWNDRTEFKEEPPSPIGEFYQLNRPH